MREPAVREVGGDFSRVKSPGSESADRAGMGCGLSIRVVDKRLAYRTGGPRGFPTSWSPRKCSLNRLEDLPGREAE